MPHNLQLHLKLSPSNKKYPNIIIQIGEHYQTVADCTDEAVVSFDVAPGLHQIQISLTNKEPADTVVNDTGNITSDLFCVITKIVVDQSIHTDIDNFGYYNNDQNNIHTNGWMASNGTYLLNIMVPGRYFADRKKLFGPYFREAVDGIKSIRKV